MNIVLLSGGSGKRLWPLSNDIRSKQFIKIFKRDDGEYESMVQKVYRQILKVDPDAQVTIATSKSQVSAIHNQLGEEVGISIEPCRRDTFPAIVLATAYLHYIQLIPEDEAVVVCPVDPYVNDDYFEGLKQLSEQADKGEANIVLMGIEATYPSEKYGYIIPEDKEAVSRVLTFKKWREIIAKKVDIILIIKTNIKDIEKYIRIKLTKIIITKIIIEIMTFIEKEENIQVMRFHGEWKDLGTWNTLTEAMTESSIGEVIMDPTCENVHVINELNVPILAMGLNNVVISASPDGILISDKHQSSFIKPYVDGIDQQIMYAEKSWGSFRVLDVEHDSLTIKVTLNPGHQMNYHSHLHRDEVWVVISGKGTTVVDGEKKEVSVGDVIKMRAGSRHTVIALTELKMVEVQLGRDISVHDKIKYELEP